MQQEHFTGVLKLSTVINNLPRAVLAKCKLANYWVLRERHQFPDSTLRGHGATLSGFQTAVTPKRGVKQENFLHF